MKKHLVAVVAAAMLAACQSPSAAVPAKSTEATNAPAASAPSVAEPAVITPSGARFVVEIASNDPTRERGLMFRDSLAPDRGMLFIFPRTDVYPFWMKNTLIPLDMLWLDEAHRVVHIAAAVPPCQADPCPNYPPGVAARYVLEIGSGRAAAVGIKVGDVLTISGADGYRVE